MIRVLIHVRCPPALGSPERTVPAHLTLQPGFATTADEAREKILGLVKEGRAFGVPVLEQDDPFGFEPEHVTLVAAWDE